ncbi:GNAT family N-acetyltransferase [Sphingomonas sp. JC676]|uniref:GNAT family N-acetyltransferase n=1 Tax=Sphingomonas sp. JC676 TaxID=2768065 RepID=UPI001657B09D|nr:GNAT family N-acetyltransferase [Sphingomonas sp. JC676]MBC9034437.1 GNAT family N-acetyltransferase [Sphingomonas sp. JC676]
MELIPADQAVFDWLLKGAPAPAGMPLVCEGGLAPDAVMPIVADMAACVRPHYSGASAWLAVADGEAVGLISYKAAPDEAGAIDIGYGIAPAREGRGLAIAAVAALAELARANGVAGLTAETSIDNRASQRVLERNGFERSGERYDDEDGALICWSLRLAQGERE